MFYVDNVVDIFPAPYKENHPCILGYMKPSSFAERGPSTSQQQFYQYSGEWTQRVIWSAGGWIDHQIKLGSAAADKDILGEFYYVGNFRPDLRWMAIHSSGMEKFGAPLWGAADLVSRGGNRSESSSAISALVRIEIVTRPRHGLPPSGRSRRCVCWRVHVSETEGLFYPKEGATFRDLFERPDRGLAERQPNFPR